MFTIFNIYKLMLSLWVNIVRHVQSTQNEIYSISCQYIKEKVKGYVDFLHANKHESFLEIGAIIFDGGWPSIPKVLQGDAIDIDRHDEITQSKSFAISLKHLKEEVSHKIS